MYAHTLLNPSRADAIKIFDCPPLPQKFETTNERALLQGVIFHLLRGRYPQNLQGTFEFGNPNFLGPLNRFFTSGKLVFLLEGPQEP